VGKWERLRERPLLCTGGPRQCALARLGGSERRPRAYLGRRRDRPLVGRRRGPRSPSVGRGASPCRAIMTRESEFPARQAVNLWIASGNQGSLSVPWAEQAVSRPSALGDRARAERILEIGEPAGNLARNGASRGDALEPSERPRNYRSGGEIAYLGVPGARSGRRGWEARFGSPRGTGRGTWRSTPRVRRVERASGWGGSCTASGTASRQGGRAPQEARGRGAQRARTGNHGARGGLPGGPRARQAAGAGAKRPAPPGRAKRAHGEPGRPSSPGQPLRGPVPARSRPERGTRAPGARPRTLVP